MALADRRIDYGRATLDVSGVDPDPIRQFDKWLTEADAAGIAESNAMTLATASPDGVPSARIVLLKGLDQRGFVFFTDYRSRKGQELERNPAAALVFFWRELERQVRVTGRVTRTSDAESAEYFFSRPEGSRLGAWTSHQSSVIAGRAELEAALDATARRFRGQPIPRPAHWGGYRLAPDSIELWQGRPNRLHDRIRYRKEADRWVIERLSP